MFNRSKIHSIGLLLESFMAGRVEGAKDNGPFMALNMLCIVFSFTACSREKVGYL